MRFLSTFSQLQLLILKKVFTRAWTNIHTANSCVCVPLVSEPLLLVCKHATVFICACVFAIHKRAILAAILDKAHHTHENLPSELRREGDTLRSLLFKVTIFCELAV